MRKLWTILPLVLMLYGCTGKETMETISDDWVQPVMASPRSISVQLPEEVAVPVMESNTEQVYLCEAYEIILETCSSGNLGATIKQISGHSKDNLTVMQTGMNNVDRYEFVWTAAGEKGDRLGRAVILDDGQYHYCLSVLRDADNKAASQITWNEIFQSFQLT